MSNADQTDGSGEKRMQPEPADDWPDEPYSEEEARTLLFDREGTRAVWVMDHDDATRTAILGPNPPDDAVIDVVVETEESFGMFSYTHYEGTTQWVTYGEEQKGTEGAETMRGTLADYRLLAGDSELS